MEKELDRESGVFREASFKTSIRNSTTSSCHSSGREAGSGEDRNSSQPGKRLGSLTIKYQAGVISREIKNTTIRSSRRYVPTRGGK